jgi:hypothetical protein
MKQSPLITGHCCDRPVKRVRQLRLVEIEHEEVWGKVTTPALLCQHCLRAMKAGWAMRFAIDETGTVTRKPDEAA